MITGLQLPAMTAASCHTSLLHLFLPMILFPCGRLNCGLPRLHNHISRNSRVGIFNPCTTVGLYRARESLKGQSGLNKIMGVGAAQSDWCATPGEIRTQGSPEWMGGKMQWGYMMGRLCGSTVICRCRERLRRQQSFWCQVAASRPVRTTISIL